MNIHPASDYVDCDVFTDDGITLLVQFLKRKTEDDAIIVNAFCDRLLIAFVEQHRTYFQFLYIS